MERNELALLLSEIFIPIGFKKKGNYWVKDGNEITIMVNLQKSQFSNRFYINYGYIIKSIPLDGLMMHVFKGLGSINNDENTEIKELLDLENTLSDPDRADRLKEFILKKIVSSIQAINTEKDVLNELKTWPNLNAIPGIVKNHFNLM